MEMVISMSTVYDSDSRMQSCYNNIVMVINIDRNSSLKNMTSLIMLCNKCTLMNQKIESCEFDIQCIVYTNIHCLGIAINVTYLNLTYFVKRSRYIQIL